MGTPDERADARQELIRRIAAFKGVLDALPRFDSNIPIAKRQGDHLDIKQAYGTYRSLLDVARQCGSEDLVRSIYGWPTWRNLKRLLDHTDSRVLQKKAYEAEKTRRRSRGEKTERALREKKRYRHHRWTEMLPIWTEMFAGVDVEGPPPKQLTKALMRLFDTPEQVASKIEIIRLLAAIHLYERGRPETFERIRRIHEGTPCIPWTDVEARLDKHEIERQEGTLQ